MSYMYIPPKETTLFDNISDSIIEKAIELYRVDPTINRRLRPICELRQVCMYIILDKCRRLKVKHTLEDIALKVNLTSHATVLHGYKVVDNMIATSKDFREKYLRFIYENK